MTCPATGPAVEREHPMRMTRSTSGPRRAEAEAQAVSVRSRAKGDEGVLPFAGFLERVKTEIATRALAVKIEKKV